MVLLLLVSKLQGKKDLNISQSDILMGTVCVWTELGRATVGVNEQSCDYLHHFGSACVSWMGKYDDFLNKFAHLLGHT